MQYDYLINQALFQEIKSSFTSIRGQLKKNKYVIVDVGCGNKPYFSIFQPFVKDYIGVDINPAEADVVASGEELPLEDHMCDLALSFQTLEHCRKPEKMVSEIRRILKPGGLVILTTHGSWMHHPSPHDYYRWTSEGLAQVFKNFSRVEIRANLKAWTSIIQLVNVELHGIALRHVVWKIPLYLIIMLLNLVGTVSKNLGYDHFTVNYIVVAKR